MKTIMITMINKLMGLTIIQLFMNTTIGKLVGRTIQEVMNLWIQVGMIEKGFILILMVLPIPAIKEVYIITRTVMIKRKTKRA